MLSCAQEATAPDLDPKPVWLLVLTLACIVTLTWRCTWSALIPGPPKYTPPGSRAMPLACTPDGSSRVAAKSG